MPLFTYIIFAFLSVFFRCHSDIGLLFSYSANGTIYCVVLVVKRKNYGAAYHGDIRAR
ncbi:hypothetical protein Echvi_2995 [Echinicola vietnamensis DSM 17526]|uniref:Uncharacterized protein n=1 Tax=Echinicola vietnamensis (strain DSM 17526 / LMG 23754 / KMM 6221) TaxID=926556 RepID=L0G1P9_ECHVK|nr:hypothetical protein Echvi_2995 [Echinicola vietnamensis DSM 17526]